MNIHRSRFTAIVLAFTFAVALTAAAVRPAGAEGMTTTSKTGSWFIGLGVGGGTAGLTQNGTTSKRETAPSASFRVGYDMTSMLSLGIQTNGWRKSEKDASNNDVATTFSVTTATIFYHPPAANGLELRGGVGLGTGDASIASGGTTLSESQSGFGFNLGAGYGFPVGRSFSIGPTVDFGWMTLKDFDANFVNFGVAFDWRSMAR